MEGTRESEAESSMNVNLVNEGDDLLLETLYDLINARPSDDHTSKRVRFG